VVYGQVFALMRQLGHEHHHAQVTAEVTPEARSVPG